MENPYKVITAVSCGLSILGSVLVGLTSIFPADNRSKPGKQLLLYLSITDFFTPLIYFQQIFYNETSHTTMCTVSALLGILFPVASFLYTDVIAWYLFNVIVKGIKYTFDEWKAVLFRIHVCVWTTSIAVIAIVYFTNHAGYGTEGWCWIRGSSNLNQFYWEIMGGKCIEWLSSVIVLPYFYLSAACKLKQLNDVDHQYQLIAENSTADRNGRSKNIESKFGKFYFKMTIVPISFFVIRFWGSLQVLLQLGPSPTYKDNVILLCLKFFFDPSQGFVNFVLFVATSVDGQKSVKLGVAWFLLTFFWWCPGSISYSRNLIENARKSSSKAFIHSDGGRLDINASSSPLLDSNSGFHDFPYLSSGIDDEMSICSGIPEEGISKIPSVLSMQMASSSGSLGVDDSSSRSTGPESSLVVSYHGCQLASTESNGEFGEVHAVQRSSSPKSVLGKDLSRIEEATVGDAEEYADGLWRVTSSSTWSQYGDHDDEYDCT